MELLSNPKGYFGFLKCINLFSRWMIYLKFVLYNGCTTIEVCVVQICVVQKFLMLKKYWIDLIKYVLRTFYVLHQNETKTEWNFLMDFLLGSEVILKGNTSPAFGGANLDYWWTECFHSGFSFCTCHIFGFYTVSYPQIDKTSHF